MGTLWIAWNDSDRVRERPSGFAGEHGADFVGLNASFIIFAVNGDKWNLRGGRSDVRRRGEV